MDLIAICKLLRILEFLNFIICPWKYWSYFPFRQHIAKVFEYGLNKMIDIIVTLSDKSSVLQAMEIKKKTWLRIKLKWMQLPSNTSFYLPKYPHEWN